MISLSRKVPIVATVLTIVSILVLCALGTWQLKRLAWKNNLIEQMEIAYAQDIKPISIKDFSDLKRGSVEGDLLCEKSLLIGPRTNKGASGFHLFTPLVVEEGATLLINRGWVPLGFNKDSEKCEGALYYGILRRPEKPNMFVPQNQSEEDVWYRLDLNEISQVKKIENILPFVMYVENNLLEERTNPLPHRPEIRLRNNHLQYAFFWYSMALILLIIYFIRFYVYKN